MSDGALASMVTERDLTRAMADAIDPRTGTVGDYMTPEVAVVDPDTDAKEAARIMVEGGIRHLPVLDGEGQLLGLISARDVSLELIWTPQGSYPPTSPRSPCGTITTGHRACCAH